MSDPIVVANKTKNQERKGIVPVPVHQDQGKKSIAKEWAKTILYAIIISTLFKSLLYENFKIPSGSMNPTLLEGDRVIVSKYYYGYSKYSFPFNIAPIDGRILANRTPKYGDVVVFQSPKGTGVFYIKRIIGLPGDSIIVSEGEVIINGKKLEQEKIKTVDPKTYTNYNIFSVEQFKEHNLDGKVYDIFIGSKQSDVNNTKTYTVPQNHYFVMGDNRDNSKDSRFDLDFGFIPFEFIVGRAEIIFFSSSDSPLKIWSLPKTIRLERFFNSLVAPIEQE